MAQKRLNRTDVGAVHQQIGREAVPYRVGANLF